MVLCKRPSVCVFLRMVKPMYGSAWLCINVRSSFCSIYCTPNVLVAICQRVHLRARYFVARQCRRRIWRSARAKLIALPLIALVPRNYANDLRSSVKVTARHASTNFARSPQTVKCRPNTIRVSALLCRAGRTRRNRFSSIRPIFRVCASTGVTQCS